jgi:hypothetical protein
VPTRDRLGRISLVVEALEHALGAMEGLHEIDTRVTSGPLRQALQRARVGAAAQTDVLMVALAADGVALPETHAGVGEAQLGLRPSDASYARRRAEARAGVRRERYSRRGLATFPALLRDAIDGDLVLL